MFKNLGFGGEEKQGSQTPRQQSSIDLWPVGNLAAQAVGKHAKLYLRMRGIRLHMCNHLFPLSIGTAAASLQTQKGWGPLA